MGSFLVATGATHFLRAFLYSLLLFGWTAFLCAVSSRALGGHKLVVTDGAFPVTTDFSWLFLVEGDDAAGAPALWTIHSEIRQLSRESIPTALPSRQAFFWVLLCELYLFRPAHDGDAHSNGDAGLHSA